MRMTLVPEYIVEDLVIARDHGDYEDSSRWNRIDDWIKQELKKTRPFDHMGSSQTTEEEAEYNRKYNKIVDEVFEEGIKEGIIRAKFPPEYF